MLASCPDTGGFCAVLVVEEAEPANLDNPPKEPEDLPASDPDRDPVVERTPLPPAATSAREGEDAVDAEDSSSVSFRGPTEPKPVLESPASPPPERNVNPAVPGRTEEGDPDGCTPNWVPESADNDPVALALPVLAPAADEEEEAASPTRDLLGGAVLLLASASCESDDPPAAVAIRVAVVVAGEEDWAREASDLRGVAVAVPPRPANCDNDGDPVLAPAAASDDVDGVGVRAVDEEVARLARDLRGGALLFAAS